MPCFALCAWNIFAVHPTTGILIRITHGARLTTNSNYTSLLYCKYVA